MATNTKPQHHTSLQHSTTPTEHERLVIKAYQEGKSLRFIKICQAADDHKLYHILAKHNIPLRTRPDEPYPRFDADAVVEDYKAGMKVKQILAKHNISGSSLYHTLAVKGVRGRNRRVRLSPAEREQAIELYKAGTPIMEICDTLNIHPPTLYNILPADIPRRNAR